LIYDVKIMSLKLLYLIYVVIVVVEFDLGSVWFKRRGGEGRDREGKREVLIIICLVQEVEGRRGEGF